MTHLSAKALNVSWEVRVSGNLVVVGWSEKGW